LTARSDDAGRFSHYTLAKQTGGMSPTALRLAYMDWALHLALAPGTHARFAGKLLASALAFQDFAGRAAWMDGSPVPEAAPAPGDKRFARPDWSPWR
jgi:polyhydroxyalkanoate synthase subunit PhaC